MIGSAIQPWPSQHYEGLQHAPEDDIMSWSPCPDPIPGDRASADAIEMLIVPRAVDLGEMEVRRALPSLKRQMVGPFIFFDQMGPAEFLTDQGIDVRPHPHINLATVTYLFEGQILHRDSLRGRCRPALDPAGASVAGAVAAGLL